MIWQLLVCSGSIATNVEALAKAGNSSTTVQILTNAQ